MLKVNEVAQLLNVHINTVRRWSNQNILKAYRVGPRGDRRFKLEDIQNFIETNMDLLP
jgi:excisionase family DNA binding protein